MADRPGWGIIGTGGIAADFTADLHRAGLRVAAVGSRAQETADAFAAQNDVPAAHASWEALFADSSVDIVYIANPHPFHVQAALQALDAGKHVLVEKPFTLTQPEARAVADAARDRGLVALEAMWTRFLPHMAEIRAAIADGEIGDAQVLMADHTQLLPTDPHHRMQAPELGGGALLDLGVYPVSFAVDLFGVPRSVDARATWTPTGVDARVSAVLVHEGGRHTATTVALDLPGVNGAQILGTGGTIVIDPVWYAATGYTVLDGDRRVVRRSHPEVDGRGMQFQAFEVERLIATGETSSPLMPVEESVAVMGVLDGIRREIGLVYPGEGASAAG